MSKRLCRTLVGLSASALVALTVAAPAGAEPNDAPGAVVSQELLGPDRVIPGAVSATKVTYWSTGPKDARPQRPTGPKPAVQPRHQIADGQTYADQRQIHQAGVV